MVLTTGSYGCCSSTSWEIGRLDSHSANPEQILKSYQAILRAANAFFIDPCSTGYFGNNFSIYRLSALITPFKIWLRVGVVWFRSYQASASQVMFSSLKASGLVSRPFFLFGGFRGCTYLLKIEAGRTLLWSFTSVILSASMLFSTNFSEVSHMNSKSTIKSG